MFVGRSGRRKLARSEKMQLPQNGESMRSMMTRSLLMLVILALVAPLTACGGSDPVPDNYPTDNTPAAPRAKSLVIYNYAFNPNTLTIPVGTTVIFQNKDPEQHNITIQALGVDQTLKPNTEFSYTFNAAGTYTVNNRISTSPMRATIVVR
jgi:plastocyanin